MQDVFFFFDDSGVLHKKEPSGYFVYAGYVFTNREDMENAKRMYINANKKIKQQHNLKGELKAANLPNKHKRALYNCVKEHDSVSILVDISKIYDYILEDKKSICRYKDYILKRCVKGKLVNLIETEKISSKEDITLHIFIDEQLTATNGYYDLRDSIREELQYGIINFNYGTKHSHVFDSKVIVNVQYCDSSKNYLIQASDILANRIWNAYRKQNEKLLQIANHISLTFP